MLVDTTGFEPASSGTGLDDWPPSALRVVLRARILVETEGVEPSFPRCERGALPLSYAPMVAGRRVARPRSAYETDAGTRLRPATNLGGDGRLCSADPSMPCSCDADFTTSPWCRPPVLPRIPFLFREVCDFYTRAANIGSHIRTRT